MKYVDATPLVFEESENLPEPDIIAREIVADLQDALDQFQLIAEDLGEEED